MRYRIRPHASEKLRGCWWLVEGRNGSGERYELLFRRRDVAEAFVRAGGFKSPEAMRLAERRLSRDPPPEPGA